MSSRATAVICTALGLETKAVTAHLDQVSETAVRTERLPVGVLSGQLTWDVAVIETGPENAQATARVEFALSAIQPSVLLFAGIAGGFADKGVRTFDVLVPSRVHEYGSGRAREKLDRRHRDHEPTRRLLDLAKSVDREDLWRRRLTSQETAKETPILESRRFLGRRSGGLVGAVQGLLSGGQLEAVDPRAARVWFEPLASGDHVVKSLQSDTYVSIRDDYDQVVGVDMEAAGFFTAAAQHPDVLALVVRGVSDLLSDKDRTRNSDNQVVAAGNAAAFTIELLSQIRSDQLVREGAPFVPIGEAFPRPGGRSAAAPSDARSVSESSQHQRDGAQLVILDQLARWADLIHLTAWGYRTEGLFNGYQPRLPNKFFDDLQTARSWLDGRVHPPGAPQGIADALSNFARVLRAFIDVFGQDLDVDEHSTRVARFDRQHGAGLLERRQLDRRYERHVRLIQNLGLELTRAANLVCERARRDVDPLFGVSDGKVQVAVGQDGYFEVVDYTDDERELAMPFPEDLNEFYDLLPTRAGAFLGDDGPGTWLDGYVEARPLTRPKWDGAQGLSGGEGSEEGRPIERQDGELLCWVANRSAVPIRLGEALLENDDYLTTAQRPMERVVQPGYQVAYAFSGTEIEGPSVLTVQQEAFGGRLLDDARFDIRIDSSGGTFDAAHLPPAPLDEPVETQEDGPLREATRRVSRPHRESDLRQRLQSELDEGVRLLERCPANAIAFSLSSGLMGYTSEQDVHGWEARVERLLRDRPRLLSLFRYDGKPTGALVSLGLMHVLVSAGVRRPGGPVWA